LVGAAVERTNERLTTPSHVTPTALAQTVTDSVLLVRVVVVRCRCVVLVHFSVVVTNRFSLHSERALPSNTIVFVVLTTVTKVIVELIAGMQVTQLVHCIF